MASQSTQGQGPWFSVGYRNGSDVESDAVMAQQAASSSSGSGLRVSLSQRDTWERQSSIDDVRLPTDYSLDADVVRPGGGPRSVTAASGDSWARIAKQQYGDERFALGLARANGAKSSFLAACHDVLLPDLSGTNLKTGGAFIAADAAERARNAFNFSDGRDARDIRLSFAYQSRVSRELSSQRLRRRSIPAPLRVEPLKSKPASCRTRAKLCALGIYEAYFQLDSAGGKNTSLGALAYQNSSITYDELNRISRVRDDNLYDIRYEYDAMGNRRLVDSSYWDGAAGLRDRQTYWYAYDALNRFTVSKGRLSSTSSTTSDINRFATATRGTSLTDTSVKIEAGTDGTLIGYDKLSRRASAEYTFNNLALPPEIRSG